MTSKVAALIDRRLKLEARVITLCVKRDRSPDDSAELLRFGSEHVDIAQEVALLSRQEQDEYFLSIPEESTP